MEEAADIASVFDTYKNGENQVATEKLEEIVKGLELDPNED